MPAVSEKQKSSRAATLKRCKRGVRKGLHFRCYKVLMLLLFTENPHLERFGQGFTRLHLLNFATYYSMNRQRLLDDLRLLEKQGIIHQLTLVRGKVLFQLEKPLWNEKSQYSNAIASLQRKTPNNRM